MNTDNALLIIIGAVLGIILINGLLILSLRRSNTRQQIDILRKASQRFRDPWKSETDTLKELSDRIDALSTKKVDE